jgi:methyl-accepting chemotaxis protein
MFNINNLKITNKIIIAPLIITVFLIILSGYSIDTLKIGQKNFENIIENKVELLNTGNQFSIDIKEYNLLVYRVFNYVMNVYEDSEVNEQIELIAKMQKKLAVDIKRLKELSESDPKAKKNIIEIEKNLIAYNTAINDLLNDVMNIIFDRVVEAEVYFNKMEKALQDINTNTKKHNTSIYQEEKQSVNTTLSLMYILIAVAVILSVLITVSVAKSIKVPLSKFQTGLLEFFKYINQETKEAKLIELNSTDELGTMASIINKNINKTKSNIENEKELVNSAIVSANKAREGYLDVKIDADTSNPILNELKDVINDMLFEIQKNVKNIMSVLGEYKNYNYLSEVDESNLSGDLKDLSLDINSLGASIRQMLIENKNVGKLLESNAGYLIGNMEKLNDSALNQAKSLERTAVSIDQITANMKDSSEDINKMTSYANEVSTSVSQGQELASNTASSMDQINEEVSAINEAITVIDQIAFQTNILSLNAAVEAATAGEAGKGFAVVAQEVRNLAARSAEAAKEIKELVENATVKASTGKDISAKMIEGYQNLNVNIDKTLQLINNISDSSKEQFSAMTQINTTVNELDKVTQENRGVAGETNSIADEVSKISQKVVDQVKDKQFESE